MHTQARALARASVVALVVLAPTSPVAAQRSLLFRNAVSGGARFESVSFGTGVFDGDSTTSVARATQLVVPFGAAFRLTDSWSVDVSGAFTSGEVEYGGNQSRRSLSGVSDVRVRATGNLLFDNLQLSLGVGLPTGATRLDAEQLAALRVLASPTLGFGLPSVGFGPNGAVGLVATRSVGSWVVAFGTSYEYRGSFAPIAALESGNDPEYDPGNSVHFSLGLERFIGESRLALQIGTDVFGEDKLSAGAAEVQTVRLGPIFNLDANLDVSGQRLRDAKLFASMRVRSAFRRADSTVAGSNGTYLNAGFDGGIPVARAMDVRLGADVLVHSGLDIDQSLITAGATAGGATLGLRFYGRSLSVDPFVRAAFGTVDTGLGSGTMKALTFGLLMTTRF